MELNNAVHTAILTLKDGKADILHVIAIRSNGVVSNFFAFHQSTDTSGNQRKSRITYWKLSSLSFSEGIGKTKTYRIQFALISSLIKCSVS
ncbi:unnamed protein product [Ilex paraguariensis]|uniref:Uncharacterized protein n=1 Tax=Ilex paraguariensis TaxID=185542 RepID=A0ABC8R4L0_9AQUA